MGLKREYNIYGCVCVFCVRVGVIWSPVRCVSNQDAGHQQSRDRGQDQTERGGARQAGRGVAQVGVAARLGHGENGLVGAAAGEVHLFRGVAAFSW